MIETERRAGYVEITPEMLQRLNHHMDIEEKRDAANEQAITAAQEKISDIEEDLHQIAGIVKPVAAFASMSKIFGVVAGAFLALFTWVILDKNNDIKSVQSLLQDHSIQINRTLVIIENEVKNRESDMNRVQRALDSIKGQK